MIHRVLITAGDGRDALSLEYRPDTLDEAVIREVFVGDVYHLRHDPIRAVVRDGLIIDAGANIGCFSTACLALGARYVVAIEPEAANREILRRNLEPYPVEARAILPAALGDPDETRQVRIIGTSGDAFAVSDASPTDAPYAAEPVPVFDFGRILTAAMMIRPDDPVVDLLKIDIEGGEYPWLRTATADQLRRIDRIHMEFHVEPPGLGWLCEKLAETHAVSMFGPAGTGGMIYAHPYEDPRA